jgi:hypothetical protein
VQGAYRQGWLEQVRPSTPWESGLLPQPSLAGAPCGADSEASQLPVARMPTSGTSCGPCCSSGLGRLTRGTIAVALCGTPQGQDTRGFSRRHETGCRSAEVYAVTTYGESPDMETTEDRARFTARFEFLEEPRVIEALEQRAIRAGTSVAAEIRRAIRRQLETKR